MKWFLLFIPFLMASDCSSPPSSDERQRNQQETILNEGTSEVGMPAIHNFRERRELREIYEMRDQANFVTYTYLENLVPTVVHGYTSLGGKLTFLGISIGFPIPYATQFTNSQKVIDLYHGVTTLPQADPNGLFSPASADATWVLLLDPVTKQAKPQYLEPKLVTLTYKLPVDP
jgi:hypothetical protein